jgi:hypothetical protein
MEYSPSIAILLSKNECLSRRNITHLLWRSIKGYIKVTWKLCYHINLYVIPYKMTRYFYFSIFIYLTKFAVKSLWLFWSLLLWFLKNIAFTIKMSWWLEILFQKLWKKRIELFTMICPNYRVPNGPANIKNNNL